MIARTCVTRHLLSLLGIPPGRKKRRTPRQANGPFEVSSKPRRSLRLSDGAVELTRSPVSPFVASSSLTSCPSDGDRKGRGSTGLGPSFSAPREVVAREVGACTSNPATTTAPCRSIESYLSMGNNMARKAEGGKRTRGPRTEEREAARRRERSHRTRASAASSKLCRLFRTVGL